MMEHFTHNDPEMFCECVEGHNWGKDTEGDRCIVSIDARGKCLSHYPCKGKGIVIVEHYNPDSPGKYERCPKCDLYYWHFEERG